MLNKIRNFVIAAHMCSSGCFNANQALQETVYRDADDRFWDAWVALPGWLRRVILGNVTITRTYYF